MYLYMGYVIVDLEFNNLTNITKYHPGYFEDHGNLKDIDFDNEIIEIGAIKLDKYMNQTDELKVFIKPTIFADLNPKITEITHITEDMLKEGEDFYDAITKLKDFVGQDILCSWAKDDVAELIKNARYHKYDIQTWLGDYIDLQEYCSRMLAKKKSLSLRNAVEELKINVENEKLHDALYDCICTAKVFKRLYNARSVKNFVIKNVYNAAVFSAKNIEDRVIDKHKLNYKCPHCGNELTVEEEFKYFGWRFISLCVCSRCKSKVLKEVIIKESLTGQEMYNEINTVLDDTAYLRYNYKFEKSLRNDKM